MLFHVKWDKFKHLPNYSYAIEWPCSWYSFEIGTQLVYEYIKIIVTLAFPKHKWIVGLLYECDAKIANETHRKSHVLTHGLPWWWLKSWYNIYVKVYKYIWAEIRLYSSDKIRFSAETIMYIGWIWFGYNICHSLILKKKSVIVNVGDPICMCVLFIDIHTKTQIFAFSIAPSHLRSSLSFVSHGIRNLTECRYT